MASILSGITIIFAVAWCAAALLHRASAASRHVVWVCAFAAALLFAPLRWGVPHRVLATPLPAIPTTTVPAVAATPVIVVPVSHETRFNPTNIFVALWALGTLVMATRLMGNAIWIRATIRNARRSARGKLPVLVSPRISGPVVAGVFRPLILLPRTSDTWTRARRRAVLAHEAAHIRRRDPAILFAAHIATALYWFHPLCWLAAARLRAESERACDDAALRIGLLPSSYAGHLLELAGTFETQLAIPMASTSHLETRVKSILNPLTKRSFSARAAWPVAFTLTLAILVPLATFTLRAQQASGGSASISGTVSDPTGAVVAGANMIATNTDAGWNAVAVSNPVGVYAFANLPPGHYTVETRVPGFARFQAPDLALINGGNLVVNTRLRVDGISEAVTVSAQRTLVPKPAAIPRPGAKPIRVGGNVQAAKAIQMAKPVYPADLQAQGIEGTVLLQALISKDGVPNSLSVMNPGVNQEFVNAAMQAAGQWRYQPTLLNGEPIEVMTTIQVNFKLTQ